MDEQCIMEYEVSTGRNVVQYFETFNAVGGHLGFVFDILVQICYTKQYVLPNVTVNWSIYHIVCEPT